MKYRELIIASNNNGKVQELHELLAPLNVKIHTMAEFNLPSPHETGTTFVENAIIKARAASLATGLAAISDDSGIEVDYLNGEPGVHTSSYSGEEGNFKAHISKLIQVMANVPKEKRHARFRSVLVYMRSASDPAPLIAQGIWEGAVLSSPRGIAGFGYDPIFEVPELNCSAAELSQAQKNLYSHRGKALRSLLSMLQHEW